MEPRQIELQKCRFQLEELEARIAPGILAVTGGDTLGAGAGKIKFNEFTVSDNAGRDGHGLSNAEVRTHGVINWNPGT